MLSIRMFINFFIVILTSFLISFSANAYNCVIRPNLKNNSIGFGPGFGQPNAIKGARLDYRRTWYQGEIFVFLGELSVARWYADYPSGKRMTTFGATPVVRAYPFAKPIFAELSVGVSKISSRQLGRRFYKSNWLFQDIFALGYSFFEQNVDLRVQYIHHSNAGLAKTNAAIDIFPAIQISYYF